MILFNLGEVSLGEFSPFPDPIRHGTGHTVIQRHDPALSTRPLILARIRARHPDGNQLALGSTTGPRAIA